VKEFSELGKKYRGCHLWGRGYFCSTVGAVTEDMIKKYIEDQNDDDSAFKIWSAYLQILSTLPALAGSN
jgi:putative transposase